MKNILISGIFSILFLSQISCDLEEPVGKWDDNIKLSEKELSISGDSNSVIITTEGTWWWIHGIGLNDDWNYDLSSIDTTKENFVIEESEFTIERKNATEIRISMTQNETGLERILDIGLQAGNYGDGIKIIQSSN